MEGGQSGTYLRLTRASSGPQVGVAKTYRDENKTKMNISAQTQRPSSAVEYKKLTEAEEGLIFVSFSSLYVLVTLTRGPDDALSPFHIYLFPCLSRFLIIFKKDV